MKNKNKGFLVPVLVIIIAIFGIGWWMSANKDTPSDMEATASPDVLIDTKTNADLPQTVGYNIQTQVAPAIEPVIKWSFPVLTTSPETHSTYGIVVMINGKQYDLNHEDSWAGTEIPKSKLLANQLSAARFSNGDIATEFAVVKDGSGYLVTKATYNYQRDGINIDAAGWRQKTTTHLRIK